MPPTITRRQFLQYSAAVLAALSVAPLLSAPAQAAAAAAPRQAVGAATPAFAPLPLPALLGAPVDVAGGTDGVLWVLGDSGAPSIYDPQQGAWQPYGGGIDAAAYIAYRDANDNDVVAASYFCGGEVLVAGEQNPAAISAGFLGTAMATAAGDSGFFLAATALALIIIPYVGPEAAGLAAMVACARIGIFIVDMVAKPSAGALVVLSGGLLGSVPPLAQPLKYLNNATGDISLAILLGLELIGNLGAAFVDFANTTANWDEVPTGLPPGAEPPAKPPTWSPRVHLPFVQVGP